jgi:hypothetical protein
MILPNPDYHHPRLAVNGSPTHRSLDGATDNTPSAYHFTDRTCLRLSLATSLSIAMRLLRLAQRTPDQVQDLLLNAHQAERQAALLGSAGIQAHATLVLARALLASGRHRRALEVAEVLRRLTGDISPALLAEALVIQARAAMALGLEESPLCRQAIAHRAVAGLSDAQRVRLVQELAQIWE